MNISADFPGGNIVVERIEEDAVLLHQDLRDTEGDWFYWCFRVRGAAGRTLRFQFTQGPALGVRGPACSRDQGKTWVWLGKDAVEGNGFLHAFSPEEADVRFCMAIPYTESDWQRFLARHRDNPSVRSGELCRSRQGRAVECLHVGCLEAEPRHRAVLAARHHCCETLASYVLEGMVEFVLGDPLASRLRKEVEFLVVPFMDKDGVEAGDQGKNRKPRDHNRDYGEGGLYPETAAVRALVPAWAKGRLRVALDLHCPWLRGKNNEAVYLVGSPSEGIWAEQQRFSAILEKTRCGELPFHPDDNIPYGRDWNVAGSYVQGKTFARWAAELPGISLASTLEIPYANARGAEVNADTARHLGGDLGRAIALYFGEA
jgi:hypothetical protein